MNKHTIRTRTTMFAAGLAVVAVGGATTTALLMEGSGPAVAAVHHRSSSHDPSMVGVSDPALRAAHVAHSEVIRGEGTAHRVTVSRDKAFGGSQLGESHSGAQADKATQVHMQITNNTHETLDLTSATDSGAGSHWQDRATDLAPGATETVSNYAAGDAQINLTFTGATTGAVFKLAGETPLVGSNSASGSSSSTSYIAQASAGSGYNPTDSYSIQPGQTFSYTGQTTTYTVPPGVTQLSVAAAGGAGGDTAVLEHEPNGAEVKGDLAVTPGEVLTLGVGGHGSCMYNALGGGAGLTSGSANDSGGTGPPRARTALIRRWRHGGRVSSNNVSATGWWWWRCRRALHGQQRAERRPPRLKRGLGRRRTASPTSAAAARPASARRLRERKSPREAQKRVRSRWWWRQRRHGPPQRWAAPAAVPSAPRKLGGRIGLPGDVQQRNCRLGRTGHRVRDLHPGRLNSDLHLLQVQSGATRRGSRPDRCARSGGSARRSDAALQQEQLEDHGPLRPFEQRRAPRSALLVKGEAGTGKLSVLPPARRARAAGRHGSRRAQSRRAPPATRSGVLEQWGVRHHAGGDPPRPTSGAQLINEMLNCVTLRRPALLLPDHLQWADP